MTRERLKAEYRRLAQRAQDARRAAPDFPGYLDEEWDFLLEEARLEDGGVSPRGWAADIGELLSDMSVEEWEAQNIEFVEGEPHELSAIFMDEVEGR